MKRWTLTLFGCNRKGLTPSVKILGATIGQHADYRDGTVYVGSDRLGAILGISESKVFERRKALKGSGWMVDTGRTKGRAKVYKLTIPDCECGNC
ncbi:hypothetical protein ACFWVU_18475 [Streptomyces sp. NPDC058686]|uniref:hypothetical protein n=1 Tax=Streptomyces sp. NPDC058686 TaxID=3346599 RepID=UPI00365EC11B